MRTFKICVFTLCRPRDFASISNRPPISGQLGESSLFIPIAVDVLLCDGCPGLCRATLCRAGGSDGCPAMCSPLCADGCRGMCPSAMCPAQFNISARLLRLPSPQKRACKAHPFRRFDRTLLLHTQHIFRHRQAGFSVKVILFWHARVVFAFFHRVGDKVG